MHEQELLIGERVLVLEDDYFLATDTASVLEAAGAEVVGPCSSLRGALDSIELNQPSAAVLDINLGSGPVFDAAEALLERQVPFVFLTGYDQSMIPGKFATIARLQKPVDGREIVRSLTDALNDRTPDK